MGIQGFALAMDASPIFIHIDSGEKQANRASQRMRMLQRTVGCPGHSTAPHRPLSADAPSTYRTTVKKAERIKEAGALSRAIREWFCKVHRTGVFFSNGLNGCFFFNGLNGWLRVHYYSATKQKRAHCCSVDSCFALQIKLLQHYIFGV